MSAAHALDGRNPEDGFFVQNPWGCEQRFRWDIQSCVPDVLVTNLAQLNVLASRTTNADEEIFAQTREYLATEGAKFHLVLDELHLYGTQAVRKHTFRCASSWNDWGSCAVGVP